MFIRKRRIFKILTNLAQILEDCNIDTDPSYAFIFLVYVKSNTPNKRRK